MLNICLVTSNFKDTENQAQKVRGSKGSPLCGRSGGSKDTEGD